MQYHVPLYRLLTENPGIDLEVWYLDEVTNVGTVDVGFMREVRWGVPLLGGYRWRQIRNHSWKPSVAASFGVVNLGIWRELRRAEPNAVLMYGHAHLTMWLAAAGCVRAGIPYIVRSDALPRDRDERIIDRLRTLLVHQFVRRAGLCLAGGAGNRCFYEGLGVPRSRIRYSPYSVDNSFFAAGAARARLERNARLHALGLDPTAPTVLFVGKYQPWKRPADVVEAVKRLTLPVNLLMVGDGPLRPELEAAVAEHPRCRVRGFADQQELAELYGLADVICLPSSREAWGLVINEAMAAGVVPVVSVATGCAGDLVDDSCGGVHEVGDIDRMAALIEGLVAEPGHLRTMSQRAVDRVSDYSPDESATTLLHALELLR